MNKHLLLSACLLPVACHADTTRLVLTSPDPPRGSLVLTSSTPVPANLPPATLSVPLGKVPGLTFVLPAPSNPSVKLPPKVKLVPQGKLPGSAVPLALPAPTAPRTPTVERGGARLGVFTEDDRAVTRTFHPLLTPETPVQTIQVRPAAPSVQR